MKAELVPENGDPPIPITRDLVVVGRRDYCDIVINHAGVSKRHCVIVKTDGLLVIRDLISTNGTKVKGQKIRWAALLPEDRIALGNYKLRVYYGPDDVPGPSELYRARAERARSARQSAAGPGHSPPATPAAPVSRTAGFAPAPAPSEGRNQGFPAPSPLEVHVASLGPENVSLPSGNRHDFEPLIPIILDDSDEIIDLD
jgi:predicted component of type VI protein secretion system